MFIPTDSAQIVQVYRILTRRVEPSELLSPALLAKFVEIKFKLHSTSLSIVCIIVVLESLETYFVGPRALATYHFR